jgi:hypothetical protein
VPVAESPTHSEMWTILLSLSLLHTTTLAYTPLGGRKYPHRVTPLGTGYDEWRAKERDSSSQTTVAKEYDVLDYIDPLIGTAAGGHVFPGATMPFGMLPPKDENQLMR